MLKTYNPDIVEKNTISDKFYESKNQEKYRIMLPPITTNELHIDNALTCSIQDAIVRYKRMKGENPEWKLCSYAGFTMQMAVKKKMLQDLTKDQIVEWKENHRNIITDQLKQMGCSLDWSRQFEVDKNIEKAFCDLYDRCLIYRDKRVVNWCPYLGMALFDTEINTIELDKPRTFVLPCNKEVSLGWIYEFKYEVHEPEQKKKIKKSVLKSHTESYVSVLKKKNVRFNKNVEEIQHIQPKRYITIATTRPETIFGSTCIAVHSDDLRYLEFHGKYVIHPFNKKLLPIIPDELIDMEKGTGAINIVPCHDKNDFKFGKKYKLPFVNIFNDDGTLNDVCCDYEGMNRFDARLKVLDMLKEMELFVGKKPSKMNIDVCSESGDVIEFMVKPQWYLDCAAMAEKTTKAIENGDIKIYPEYHKSKWDQWLENTQSLCISRKLSWGHKIPAYNVKSVECGIDDWVVALNKDDVNMIVERDYSSIPDLVIEQDTDVLDTWFCSGIYPLAKDECGSNDQFYKVFSNAGEQGELSEKIDTDSILEEPVKLVNKSVSESSISDENNNVVPIIDFISTNTDNLFLWVMRTAMLSLELVGQVPFKKVYLHDVIRDIIEPLDIINGISQTELLNKLNTNNCAKEEIVKQAFPNGIPKSGADVLRLTLLNYVGHNTDICLNSDEIKKHTNFCNKLWDVFRFSFKHLFENPFEKNYVVDFNILDIHHKWIINKTIEFGAQIAEHIDNIELGKAVQVIYSYWNDTFCGTYIELIKYDLRDEMDNYSNKIDDPVDETKKKTTKLILFNILITGLKIIHPFMPYLSQYLYAKMRGEQHILCTRPWPKFNIELLKETDDMKNMDIVKEHINRIHNKKNVSELLSELSVNDLKNNLNFMLK